MKQLARKLRQNATDAEKLLWRHLRGKKLNGWKFRRQLVVEPYIVDFVCLEAKLIIEADGGQHTDQAAYDERRRYFLESLGYRVLRFWNHEILNELEMVSEHILTKLESDPLTSAVSRREGE